MHESQGAARERLIVETLAELANPSSDEFGAAESLHRLVDRAVKLLDCQDAGLLLFDTGEALRAIASAGERAGALEVLQSQHTKGPCFECYHDGVVVLSEDLAAHGERWPSFVPAALAMGFRSVQVVPMRVRGETLGALTLFRTKNGRIAARDASLAQAMADVTATTLAGERALRQADSVVAQLQAALRSRVIIEQAKGVLAARADLDVDAAFNHLRSFARHQNRRLGEVARDLVDGGRDADALIEFAGGARAGR